MLQGKKRGEGEEKPRKERNQKKREREAQLIIQAQARFFSTLKLAYTRHSFKDELLPLKPAPEIESPPFFRNRLSLVYKVTTERQENLFFLPARASLSLGTTRWRSFVFTVAASFFGDSCESRGNVSKVTRRLFQSVCVCVC